MNPIKAAARLNRTNQSLDLTQKSVRLSDFVSSGQAGRPHFTEWSTEKAIKDGYTIAPPLFACIDRIMKAVVSVRWYTATGNLNDETDREQIPNHPLTQLIYRPNPFMNRSRLFQTIVQHKYLGGNALLSKIRVDVGGRRVPVELWPIPPDKIKPIPGRRQFIEGYKIERSIAAPGRETVAVEDIIHFMFASPSDPYWGIAPLMALAQTIDTDVESLRWNMHSMVNRARSSGVLAFDQPLTEEQWEAAREKMREQHQGSENAYNIMIMPHGVSFTPWSMTAEEMDFIESRKFNREDICAVHGLMPPAVGYMEDATLANAEVADRAVWHNAAIPLLKLLREELNRSLAPEFGPNISLEFDLSEVDVLQENFAEKVQTADRLFKMGVPFNVINHRLGLEIGDIPGGGHSYLPIQLIPQPESADDHPGVSQRRPLSSGNGDERSVADATYRVKGASPSDVSTATSDEGESWSRPTLSSFTSKSWGDLTSIERRRIAGHYAYTRSMPPESFGDLIFPHHRPSDGAIVWRGVVAAAARFNQADIPSEDVPRVKAHLRRHYRHFGREDEIPDVLT